MNPYSVAIESLYDGEQHMLYLYSALSELLPEGEHPKQNRTQ